ncbi:hypothetical protein ACFC7A_26940 [Streptomyces niveus]|uniref:hypothetical protein n=1 Tax=Streptomyces niveus TaxID=193462 RepID=UPI0035DE316F
MPLYLTRNVLDGPIRETGAPTVAHAADQAHARCDVLEWPVTATAATAELARLAGLLVAVGVTVQRGHQELMLPDLATGPRDTAGIRVRTTGTAPHALYVIAGEDLAPLTHAAGVLDYLLPMIEAAARACECGADPSQACMPHCVHDPSAT